MKGTLNLSLLIFGIFCTTHTSAQKVNILGNAYVQNNLGIGVTTPDVRIDVLQNGMTARLKPSTAGHSAFMEINNSTASLRCLFGSDGTGFTGTADQFSIATWSNHPIRFFTNQAERMVISNAGKVGIGTTNPDEKLHVAGTIKANGEIQSHIANYGLIHYSGDVSMGTFIDATAGQFGTESNHPLWFFTGNNADPTMALNNTTGHVGIGTTNPEEKLHVAGTIKATGELQSHSIFYGLKHSNGNVSMGTYIDANSAQFGTESNHPLWFFTNNNGDPSMVIQDSTGLVGIRVTVPQTDLHIKQSLTSIARGIELERADNANDWRILIDTDDDFSFYFNNILKTWLWDTDGSFHMLSDRRLKKDIVMMESTLLKVLALAPATYHYIDAENSSVPMSSGFMAQDVQALFPDLVSEKNGFLGLNYVGFIPVAIKAIQEQQAIIQSQEERIAKLEAAVEELMKKI